MFGKGENGEKWGKMNERERERRMDKILKTEVILVGSLDISI